MTIIKKPAAEMPENIEGSSNVSSISSSSSSINIVIFDMHLYNKFHWIHSICATNLSEFTYVLSKHPYPQPSKKKENKRKQVKLQFKW